MSAIAWSPEARPVALPARPHLTLIEGGGGVPEAGGGLRLTARGRALLLLLATALVAAVVALTGVGGAGAVEPERTITVRPGETLSEIAARELPGMSVSEGIVAIQLANRMSTAQVGAGRDLVIPAS